MNFLNVQCQIKNGLAIGLTKYLTVKKKINKTHSDVSWTKNFIKVMCCPHYIWVLYSGKNLKYIPGEKKLIQYFFECLQMKQLGKMYHCFCIIKVEIMKYEKN